jgi:hypothetical protein
VTSQVRPKGGRARRALIRKRLLKAMNELALAAGDFAAPGMYADVFLLERLAFRAGVERERRRGRNGSDEEARD